MRYIMHILFSFYVFSCYRWRQSLLTLYITLISRAPFIPCSNAFCLMLHCLSQYHGWYIIINVSRSKCDYFVFSVFDMELCTFHEMYIVDLMRWMNGMYSPLCKNHVSFFLTERELYLLCPFSTIGPTCLLKLRYFSTRQHQL